MDTMRRTASTALTLALLAGCGGRTFYATWEDGGARPDAATHPDGGGIPDASIRPDGGPICTDPASWEPRMVPLDHIEVLSPMWGGGGVPEGVSVRLAAELTYTGCDEMGGVQAQVHPADRAIVLTGWVWRYLGTRDCPSMLSTGREIFALPGLAAGEWSVVDYLVNHPGTPILVSPCDAATGDCFCAAFPGPPRRWGEECDYDCMCEASLGCNYEGMTNMGPQCFQTCSVSSDCPAPLFCNEGFLPQSPEGICLGTGLIDACESDADCPPGHACLPNPEVGYDLCLAVMPTQPIGRLCESDCDCPAGYSCIADPTAESPYCGIRCRGNRDCPLGTRCDPELAPAGAGANALTCGFIPMP